MFINKLLFIQSSTEQTCGIPFDSHRFAFVSAVIIVIDTKCFLFKVANYLLYCFLIISIFAKHIRSDNLFLPSNVFEGIQERSSVSLHKK